MKTKNLILLLFLIIHAVIVKSQVFDKNSNWSFITTNLLDDAFLKITHYKVDGDTLIGEKKYMKLFVNDNFSAALRETEDTEIYAYFPHIEKDLLAYDFNWEEGKELKYQHTENMEIIKLMRPFTLLTP